MMVMGMMARKGAGKGLEEKYKEGGEEGKDERKGGGEGGGAILDSERDVEGALTVVASDDGLTTAVGDEGTIGDDGLEGIVGGHKELLDDNGLAVVVRARVDGAGKQLKVDDVVVKVVETIAVGNPPLVHQEGLFVSAETTDVRAAVLVGVDDGILDSVVDDDGTSARGDDVKVGGLGLEDEGKLTDKVVDAEGGEEGVDAHDRSDLVVGEAGGRVLRGIVARGAACASNVSREGEGALVTDVALLEGLRVDHTIGTDVETLASSLRGLTGAAGVAAAVALDGRETSRAVGAKTSAEGELTSRAADTLASLDGRLTRRAGHARASLGGRESRAAVGTDASRVRLLTSRALGAASTVDGGPRGRARRALTGDGGGVSVADGAELAETSRAGGRSGQTERALTSFDGREAS
jgi:hypothetical protein